MNEKLTLQDIVGLLAKKAKVTQKEADRFYRELCQLILECIYKNEIVKIKDFGTFKLVSINSRESVDVNTGEKIVIPAHYKMSFSPDKNLRRLVNKPFAHFESVVLDEEVNPTSPKEETEETVSASPNMEEENDDKEKSFSEDSDDSFGCVPVEISENSDKIDNSDISREDESIVEDEFLQKEDGKCSEIISEVENSIEEIVEDIESSNGVVADVEAESSVNESFWGGVDEIIINELESEFEIINQELLVLIKEQDDDESVGSECVKCERCIEEEVGLEGKADLREEDHDEEKSEIMLDEEEKTTSLLKEGIPDFLLIPLEDDFINEEVESKEENVFSELVHETHKKNDDSMNEFDDEKNKRISSERMNENSDDGYNSNYSYANYEEKKVVSQIKQKLPLVLFVLGVMVFVVYKVAQLLDFTPEYEYYLGTTKRFALTDTLPYLNDDISSSVEMLDTNLIVTAQTTTAISLKEENESENINKEDVKKVGSEAVIESKEESLQEEKVDELIEEKIQITLPSIGEGQSIHLAMLPAHTALPRKPYIKSSEITPSLLTNHELDDAETPVVLNDAPISDNDKVVESETYDTLPAPLPSIGEGQSIHLVMLPAHTALPRKPYIKPSEVTPSLLANHELDGAETPEVLNDVPISDNGKVVESETHDTLPAPLPSIGEGQSIHLAMLPTHTALPRKPYIKPSEVTPSLLANHELDAADTPEVLNDAPISDNGKVVESEVDNVLPTSQPSIGEGRSVELAVVPSQVALLEKPEIKSKVMLAQTEKDEIDTVLNQVGNQAEDLVEQIVIVQEISEEPESKITAKKELEVDLERLLAESGYDTGAHKKSYKVSKGLNLRIVNKAELFINNSQETSVFGDIILE